MKGTRKLNGKRGEKKAREQPRLESGPSEHWLGVLLLYHHTYEVAVFDAIFYPLHEVWQIMSH